MGHGQKDAKHGAKERALLCDSPEVAIAPGEISAVEDINDEFCESDHQSDTSKRNQENYQVGDR